MTIKFCTQCNNLLNPIYTDELGMFKCQSCHINYKFEPEDSLRKERIKNTNIMIFDNRINKTANDPAALKANIKCNNPKCDSMIVKRTYVGDDMRLYNICIKCNTSWMNT
jgi:DNA-directed RNA polymerase subunit M/transcription elongation factor TFIIS